MLNLQQVIKANQNLKQLEEKELREDDKIQREIRDISDKFYEQETILKEQKRKEIEALETKQTQKDILYQKKMEKHRKILKEFKTIVKFIGIYEELKETALATPTVYHFDYLYDKQGYINGDKQKFFYNPIAVIAEDDFKKILVYITKNDKPKNKIDLVILGNTIFADKNLIDLPYSYGLTIHHEDTNAIFLIKSFSSEEEAKNYFQKYQEKLTKQILLTFKDIEDKYKKAICELEVNKELKKEWKIAFLKDKKEYYEECYFNGKETLAYKNICKELEKLTELKK